MKTHSLPVKNNRMPPTCLLAPSWKPGWGLFLFLLVLWLAAYGAAAQAAPVYLRFKIVEPAAQHFRVSVSGFRHADPWQFPTLVSEVSSSHWSGWLDLSSWPWHERLDRSGGVAEWPSVKITAARLENKGPLQGCTISVQLAERPDEKSVVHAFTERSGRNSIGFLVPTPLREHAREFETGSQMTARHLAWAQQATGGVPNRLQKFDIVTALWGQDDPLLARQDLQTLRLLGFNVVSGVDTAAIREAGMRTYGQTFLYDVDPDAARKQWEAFAQGPLAQERATSEGSWKYRNLTHWVLSDEVSTLDFRSVEATRRDGWFRAWLCERGVTDAELGQPVAQTVYPAEALYAKTLPREADLPTRKRLYYAAKFGQWWSAKQLRHSSALVHASLPGVSTETLPTDHGFFNAWGAPHIGMSYRLLDLFELGAQHSVDQLSAEDWLGLNHMYGPGYTWTGAQSHGYFNALLRSAIGEQPILLRSLITPSDDAYLRLKAYSALGQGAKSFFFWTYGPTYIGTENYWSDLRSEYDGIAKLTHALAKSEEVLYPARPVRDPVAILYCVSHDLWHTEDPAAFVEKRLLWHGLRHLGVQPDFLREEDLEQGRLKYYKVLYLADWCVTRKASKAIEAWVRAGGVLYLSAGAATRDEFFTPYVPPYAQLLWPERAAQHLLTQRHSYNERTDLPTLQPLTKVSVGLSKQRFTLPVLGCRMNLRADVAFPMATFEDGSPAAAVAVHGKGKVMGLGFLPMLAYGQLAGFKPTTLEERWPAQPRALLQFPLTLARVTPQVQTNVPVVEVSLLTGSKGAALVLANYTYRPLGTLIIEVKLPIALGQAVSMEGHPVRQTKTPQGWRLELPLDTTDILLLPQKASQ